MASSAYMEWKYVDLEGIYMFLLTSEYPPLVAKDTGKKANFRRQSRKFSVLGDGELYKRHGKGGKQLKVIIDREERQEILGKLHEGERPKGKTANIHFGQDKTENRILEKYWWPGIRGDVRSFIASCVHCQKRTSRFQRVPLESVSSSQFVANPWEHVGVDLCAMPKSKNGFSSMIVAVDYYSKWVEAEPLAAKSADNVANFLYRLFCRHGCAEMHINKAANDFVDEVSTHLNDLTSIKQTLTGDTDPEACTEFETNSCTIQDFLMKLFSSSGDEDDWPSALPGVLFSYRTSKNASTSCSPFYLLYGRHPKLPDNFQSDETVAGENSSSAADAEPSPSQDTQAQDNFPCTSDQDPCENKSSEDNLQDTFEDYCENSKQGLQAQSDVQTLTVRETNPSLGAEDYYQDRKSFGVPPSLDLNNHPEQMGYFYRNAAQEQYGNTSIGTELEDTQNSCGLKRKWEHELSEGDKVLYMSMDASAGDGVNSWLGPYTIIRQLEGDVFELQADDGTGFIFRSHGSNLKRYLK